MRFGLCSFTIGLLFAAAGAQASVVSLDLNSGGVVGTTTINAPWKVTAGGAVNATPYEAGSNYIGLSSDGNNTGTPIAGLTAANFDGWAIFQYSFVLPTNASGVMLQYTGLAADDRSALEVNGNVLGYEGINASAGQVGSFVLADGGASTSATYAADQLTGSDAAYFIAGQVNTISVVVNATYHGWASCTVGSPLPSPGVCTSNGLDRGDLKQTGFDVSSLMITYAVPEPSSLSSSPSGWSVLC